MLQRNMLDVVLNTLQANMPGAHIYWQDKSGIILGCNENQAQALGYSSSKEVIGKHPDALIPSEESKAIINILEKVIATGSPMVLEETLTFQGQKKTFLSKKVPLRDEEETIFGMLGLSIDITDRVKMEEQLKAEKMKSEAASKAKSEFIANMSHDIRTPITGIVGMAQELLNTSDRIGYSLRKKVLNTKEKLITLLEEIANIIKENGDILMASTDQLLKLCNEILEVVSLESGGEKHSPVVFNLKELLIKNIALLTPVAKHKNLTISYDIQPDIPLYLRGLRMYLERTLLNLISNALKFTEKGSVRIEIIREDKKNVNTSVGKEILLKILVKDTGIGIPTDKFDTIFEHFSRLTPTYEGLYQGAGLGLYTVKRYMEALGGKIHVTSKLGEGSCFELSVPFVVSTQEKYIASSRESGFEIYKKIAKTTHHTHVDNKADNPNKPSILVVEDSPIAARALKVNLAAFDCNIHIAETGLEALELASKNDYALVFMDMGLPDISGIEVVKKIRALKDKSRSRVPIIALTAHAGNPEKREEALNAGMQDVMNKPAMPLMLEAFIQHYIFDCEKVCSDKVKKEKQSDQVKLKIIDWDGCIKMCNDDEKFMRDLLNLFSKDIKISKDKIKTYYHSKNFHELRAELHRLKGGICYLKLPQLEEVLNDFHRLIKDIEAHQQNIDNSYHLLIEAFDSLTKTINRKLN